MYDLHSLGWSAFQQLCLTIIREVLGQTVESFIDTRDGGRDGAFSGTWESAEQDDLQGRFVIQCKFTARSDGSLRAGDLKDEVNKAQRLVQNKKCDVYVLITNAKISGTEAEKIEDAFRSVGVSGFRIFGATWIWQQIRENKRLRLLVPRLYGIGDLTQILDERAYTQARTLLASMQDDLSKVVITDSYRKAAEALSEHGFVLLIGEPAAGKTTIASMLSMGAIDQWGALTLKCDSPSEVVEHWNPDEPSQFFWVDDAFGVTQYEPRISKGWNHVFPKLRAMIRNGSKVVMTSRNYIYRRARVDLKSSAFPLLKESQVIVDVHDLSEKEKRQILYNHIRLGRQSQEFRKKIKPFLQGVADNADFVPEVARRLGDPQFTKFLFIGEHSLARFVEEPEEFLMDVLSGIDSDSKAALALIFMRGGNVRSPVELEETEKIALQRFGSDQATCLPALDALKGSLVRYVIVDGEALWRFAHPTISDAFARLLATNPEWLGIYVHGSPVDKLIYQVTCGDVGFERAVVIPASLFNSVLERLDSFEQEIDDDHRVGWATDRIRYFLARRCDKRFLSLYISTHPELLEDIAEPGLMLSAVSEVDLGICLHKYDLLPEIVRQSFVRTVCDYAVEGEDLGVYSIAGLYDVLTDTERENLCVRVEEKLLPDISYVIDKIEERCNGDPTSELDEFTEGLKSLGDRLENGSEAWDAVQTGISHAQDVIASYDFDLAGEDREGFDDVGVSNESRGDRSIFDDVDL